MTDLGPGAHVLVEETDLRRRVGELAAAISDDYATGPPPVLVSVLKGSSIFLADLARGLRIDVRFEFMSLSSYEGGRGGGGRVRIVKDLEQPIDGEPVLIVEDIVDTGFTLHFLKRSLGARSPSSLKTVTLLDKAVRRIVPVDVEWTGFEIPDVFVLGYGLDHQGIYRNLRHLIAVEDVAALAAQPDLYVDALWPQP